MKKELKVLIVEDHPLIVSGFKDALEYFSNDSNEDIDFNITVSNDCGSAFSRIKMATGEENVFDIVFLDIKLPPSLDHALLSGEDLGVKIREYSPKTKIIIATTYEDNYRLMNLFKTIDPEGLLIKSELTHNDLINAIEFVIDDAPYYSKSVLKLIKKISFTNFMLDHIDRRILYELSKGYRISELPDILHLSIQALQKRKRRLKEYFNISSNSDYELLKAAKEKGFI